MRRTWLIFSQAVTVAVAILFVVSTLKPEWLPRRAASSAVVSLPPVPQPLSVAALAALLQFRLGRAATVVEGDGRPLQRVAWCTGGAQGYFEAAIAAGADAFITGELSEPQAHYARETGVAYFACGHHASERYGAPAVAAQVAQQFGLEHQFIDIDNPA